MNVFQTGEGKTYVVAALAVYEVLNGNKVDVITSSSELAVNQYNELFVSGNLISNVVIIFVVVMVQLL